MNGIIRKENEEIKELWKRHFESMMNKSMGGRAEVTSMRIMVNEGWPYPLRKVERGVCEGNKEVKSRKGPRH